MLTSPARCWEAASTVVLRTAVAQGPIRIFRAIFTLILPLLVAGHLPPDGFLDLGRRSLLQEPTLYLESEQGIADKVQPSEPPQGSYTLVSTNEAFVEALTSAEAKKRVRLSPGITMSPCAGITVKGDTSVAIDCQGSTIDIACSDSWFHLETGANVKLYECHVLWPPTRDFFNTKADTSQLRLEDKSWLSINGGSSTIWCPVRLKFLVLRISYSTCAELKCSILESENSHVSGMSCLNVMNI
jgi:hypothetical protein